MSNKTQLQTNNAALDSYITRINAAKDVAASLPEAGGASVDTCTIVFDSKYNDALHAVPAVLSVYENGVIQPYIYDGWTLKDVTVSNVVCSSLIVLENISNLFTYDSNSMKASGGAEVLQMNSSNKYVILRAPSTAGATGTIWFVCA
jgi:hypothetical protein